MAGGKLATPSHNRKQSKLSTVMGDLANFAQIAQKSRNLDFVRRGYNDTNAYRSRLAVKIALRELITRVSTPFSWWSLHSALHAGCSAVTSTTLGLSVSSTNS
jgi:hypothetical protein